MGVIHFFSRKLPHYYYYYYHNRLRLFCWSKTLKHRIICVQNNKFTKTVYSHVPKSRFFEVVVFTVQHPMPILKLIVALSPEIINSSSPTGQLKIPVSCILLRNNLNSICMARILLSTLLLKKLRVNYTLPTCG
jgi:hypothetical protein